MARRKKGQKVDGWIILDKPYEMSSTQALGKVRWLLDAQKGGHGGTLDPLATGVLPLAFGEATKTIPYILNAKKTYQFDVTFGTATNTDDIEGEVVETSDHIPTAEDIQNTLPKFTGDIEQVPPAYSALKIDGERAYAKARKGEEVVMKPRLVTILELEFQGIEGNVATFEAIVSKGTYIRSLGRDIASALGSCGHISRLRRTSIGEKGGKLTEKQAISLEDVEKKVASAGGKGHIPPHLLGAVDSLLDDIPAHEITPSEAQDLKLGKELTLPQVQSTGLLRAVNAEGQILSLLDVTEGGQAKIVRNFNINDIV